MGLVACPFAPNRSPTRDLVPYSFMKSTHFPHALRILATSVALLCQPAGRAGTELEAAPGKDKIVAPVEDKNPLSMVTFGGKFSKDLESGFVDGMLQFWSPGDFAFFLNTRSTLDDNQQLLSSYGLGARYLVPDRDIILGANAYYDSIHSAFDNDFDQLGLGAEVLTRWVDVRFNYYLPEDSLDQIDQGGGSDRGRGLGPVFGNKVASNRVLLQRQRTTTSSRSTTKRFEGALEGFNAEVGFLVPGLDRYMEVRLFAGAYYYDNPFGSDYSGFKARLEARFLPGLIADVEYWDDAYLTGGHWTGELRVSVPFAICNLAQGRNPFEGTAEMFRPRQREFRERLSDMVIRSHRVMSTASPTQTTNSSSTSQETVNVGQVVLQPPVKKVSAARTPPPERGEG